MFSFHIFVVFLFTFKYYVSPPKQNHLVKLFSFDDSYRISICTRLLFERTSKRLKITFFHPWNVVFSDVSASFYAVREDCLSLWMNCIPLRICREVIVWDQVSKWGLNCVVLTSRQIHAKYFSLYLFVFCLSFLYSTLSRFRFHFLLVIFAW